MIFIMKPDGTIMPSIPSPVYQGADGTNVIYLFAPSMVGNTATVAFRTPDGVWTERERMTQVAALPEEFSKYNYCVWQYAIGAPIARLDGVVTVQFFFYSNGAILPSSASSFVVGKGVPVILPTEPSQGVYDQILQAISAIQKSQQYGDYAARAIFEWRKERVDGAAISYGKGEFTYVPAGTESGPQGETGSFIKSLVDDNTQPPYVNGELNSEYWESVVNFDYLNDLYFTTLKTLVSEAEGYKDAAEAAQSGALTAKDAAEAAQSGALTAKEEAQAAQTQAELSKEQAGEYAEQTARDAANAIASAQTATEAAARAEEFAKYGIRINTDYSSADALPRPGNPQFIYFIPNGSSSPNAYDEYVWTEKGEYEKIGTTEIDLSAYLTKTEAQNTYLTQTSAGQTYLTQTSAGQTYLTQTDAERTYLTQSSAEQTYLAKAQAFLAAHPPGSYYSSVNATPPASLFGGSWTSLGSETHIKNGTEQWTDESWYVPAPGCGLSENQYSVMKKRNANEHYFNINVEVDSLVNGKLIGYHPFKLSGTFRVRAAADMYSITNSRWSLGVDFQVSGEILIYITAGTDTNPNLGKGGIFGVNSFLIDNTPVETYTEYKWRRTA